jgi:hypothetical protein
MFKAEFKRNADRRQQQNGNEHLRDDAADLRDGRVDIAAS